MKCHYFRSIFLFVITFKNFKCVRFVTYHFEIGQCSFKRPIVILKGESITYHK